MRRQKHILANAEEIKNVTSKEEQKKLKGKYDEYSLMEFLCKDN